MAGGAGIGLCTPGCRRIAGERETSELLGSSVPVVLFLKEQRGNEQGVIACFSHWSEVTVIAGADLFRAQDSF